MAVKFFAVQVVHYSFSRKLLPQAPPEFSIDNTLIPIATHTRFLGVIFDHKLSWKLHIDSLLMKVQKRSQLIKLLCSHKYGPDISTVAILYKSLIRSIIDYGSIVLATAPSSLIQKLDVAQNSILRLILGAFRSTPVDLLHLELGIEPISARISRLSLSHLLKLSFRPHNSAYPYVSSIQDSSPFFVVSPVFFLLLNFLNLFAIFKLRSFVLVHFLFQQLVLDLHLGFRPRCSSLSFP